MSVVFWILLIGLIILAAFAGLGYWMYVKFFKPLPVISPFKQPSIMEADVRVPSETEYTLPIPLDYPA